MKRIILGLLGLVLSFALSHAKTPPPVPLTGTVTTQTWVQYNQSFPGITLACGKPFHFIALPPPQYNPTLYMYPLYIWLHSDGSGNENYIGSGGNPFKMAAIGAGEYNTIPWLTNYPAVYAAPSADQTNGNGTFNSCSGGADSAIENWGGWFNNGTVGSGTHYSGDTGPNTFAIIQMILYLETQYSIDPNRIYVNGFSLGGIGGEYLMQHYNAYNGDKGRYFAAGSSQAGVDQADTPVTTATANTMRNVPVWYFSGKNDTQSPAGSYNSPLCTALGGNPATLTAITSATANRCGTSEMRYTLCPTCGHTNVDASGANVWTNLTINNFLFSKTAGTSPGGGPSPPCVVNCSTLPSGFLTVSGNQTVDGSGNNVRMACVAYDRPTASVSADMTTMRAQGFNCARVPWFDKVTCPAGVCNFTAFDAIVSAATSAGMKVVFDHQANEGVNGTGTCTNQQANGLWYDLNSTAPWNVTNNTDGCGTAGTVTYAQFKANWVSFGLHYASNSTVIGFDLHNEPTTFGNAACCGTTGGGGGTGAFEIVNGQIIDPNGNTFHAAGANVYWNNTTMAQLCPTSACTKLKTDFPNINFIRVVWQYGYTQSTSSPSPGASMEPYITWLTNLGIVVAICDFNIGPGQPPASGTTLTNEVNWYRGLATTYKANPYVWYEAQNEMYGPGATMSSNHLQLYNAVRSQTAKGIVFLGWPGGGNPGTIGTAGNIFFNNVFTGPMTQSTYAAMNHIVWDLHFYPFVVNKIAGSYSTDLNVIKTVLSGNVAGAYGVVAAQTFRSVDGVVPVIVGEFGNSTTGLSLDPDGAQLVTATYQMPATTTGGIAATAGGASYAIGTFAIGVTCCNALTDSNSNLTSPYGVQVSNLIAANPPPTPPSSAIGANWGGGNGGDMRAMVQDVGPAIQAVNPNALLIVEGIVNNGTLFNGVTRGSTSFPITAGSIGDLSTIATSPPACCGGRVVYSVHDLPTSLSGIAPDTGAAASTMRTTAWGYLEKNNTAPVWVGKMGASLDNSNGQFADETGWASSLTSYMNGQLGGQGGPTFTGCQQPIGGGWFDFGNNAGIQPNGTLNPDGSNKAGQQAVWATTLYTTCTGPTPPSGGATAWNPADASTGIVLSGSNMIATISLPPPAWNSVRSTTSQTGGKVCFAVVATTISGNWDVGISNSSFVLTVGGGLGVDSNGVGFDPRSGLGVFYNNTVLNPAGAGTSPNGEEQLICADLTAKLIWATNATMRGNGTPWNNLPGSDPATGTGGLSFAGLTCPCFITWNDAEAASATLNAAGPFAIAIPAGFAAWQQPVTSGGHPMVLIFGANDNNRFPANENRIAFAQPMELKR